MARSITNNLIYLPYERRRNKVAQWSPDKNFKMTQSIIKKGYIHGKGSTFAAAYLEDSQNILETAIKQQLDEYYNENAILIQSLEDYEKQQISQTGLSLDELMKMKQSTWLFESIKSKFWSSFGNFYSVPDAVKEMASNYIRATPDKERETILNKLGDSIPKLMKIIDSLPNNMDNGDPKRIAQINNYVQFYINELSNFAQQLEQGKITHQWKGIWTRKGLGKAKDAETNRNEVIVVDQDMMSWLGTIFELYWTALFAKEMQKMQKDISIQLPNIKNPNSPTDVILAHGETTVRLQLKSSFEGVFKQTRREAWGLTEWEKKATTVAEILDPVIVANLEYLLANTAALSIYQSPASENTKTTGQWKPKGITMYQNKSYKLLNQVQGIVVLRLLISAVSSLHPRAETNLWNNFLVTGDGNVYSIAKLLKQLNEHIYTKALTGKVQATNKIVSGLFTDPDTGGLSLANYVASIQSNIYSTGQLQDLATRKSALLQSNQEAQYDNWYEELQSQVAGAGLINNRYHILSKRKIEVSFNFKVQDFY